MKYILIALVSLTIYCGTAQSIKVMTYNIRLDIAVDGENDWAHRKDFFTSQIQFYEPDIFGVQEATPNQVIDIAKALYQYSYVGIGRDADGKGESSNIYYKKDRFRLIQESTFWLSETPDVVSKGWDAAYNRVCTYALFKELKTKNIFWVFNTHLDHIGELAKTNGIELILSKMKVVNAKKYPVIFMGDFNSEPTTDRIKGLKKVMNDSRDISETKPFGPSGTFNGFKYNEAVMPLIDYVFVSNDISVKKYAVLTDSRDSKYPLDHFPICVEIKFK